MTYSSILYKENSHSVNIYMTSWNILISETQKLMIDTWPQLADDEIKGVDYNIVQKYNLLSIYRVCLSQVNEDSEEFKIWKDQLHSLVKEIISR